MSKAGFFIAVIAIKHSCSVSKFHKGHYFVREDTPPAGWNLNGVSCSDDNSLVDPQDNQTVRISLEEMETVTCTFTNSVANDIFADGFETVE